MQSSKPRAGGGGGGCKRPIGFPPLSTTMPRLLLSPILLLLLLLLVGGVEAYEYGNRRHQGRVGHLRATADNYTCYHAPATVGDRRPDKTRLRVVQYNVEFFFLDHWTGGVPCPSPDCPWHDDTAARAHAERVAAVVKELRPDILNLCEVEGCDEVAWLAERLNEEEEHEAGGGGGAGAYGYYLLQGKDTFTGQNTALLSKIDPLEDLQRTTATVHYPIDGSQCGYTGESAHSGVSKHYVAIFDTNGMKVAVVGAHLVARPTDPKPCAQREAQATVLRSLIDGLRLQGYEVICLGDFNDFDAQVLDVNDNVPTSRVLEILKGSDLISAAEKVPKEERYTDWWDRNGDCQVEADELDMIDHVLLSPTLAQRVSSVYMYHGYPEGCDILDSDHWPVVVDFEFADEKEAKEMVAL